MPTFFTFEVQKCKMVCNPVQLGLHTNYLMEGLLSEERDKVPEQ